MKNYILTIKDEITGEVLVDINLHSYTLSLNKNISSLPIVSVSASGYYSGDTKESETEEIIPHYIDEDSYEDPNCNHRWNDYWGLEEQFTYCDTCGIKK